MCATLANCCLLSETETVQGETAEAVIVKVTVPKEISLAPGV